MGMKQENKGNKTGKHMSILVKLMLPVLLVCIIGLVAAITGFAALLMNQ